jgi:hypothetical protein
MPSCPVGSRWVYLSMQRQCPGAPRIRATRLPVATEMALPFPAELPMPAATTAPDWAVPRQPVFSVRAVSAHSWSSAEAADMHARAAAASSAAAGGAIRPAKGCGVDGQRVCSPTWARHVSPPCSVVAGAAGCRAGAYNSPAMRPCRPPGHSQLAALARSRHRGAACPLRAFGYPTSCQLRSFLRA